MGKLKSSRSGAIPTRFLKDGINEVANSLSFLYNRSIEEGSFPLNLKIASVCPIYKDEGHKDNPSNYRPVSILPIIARVFEKLIHIQLFRYLESTIFKYQSGFRPKHSTKSSVLNSTNRWLLNIDQGNYNIAVFVDLKKAFDTVNHEILLKKLRYYGIDNIELKWFTSYLTDRKQYTVVDGAMSSESNVNHGVPQGSCLGPLLFLVYINDLPICLEKCTSKLYADNTDISASNKSIKEAEKQVNNDLNNIHNWLIANKLSLSVLKTNYMIFSMAHKVKNCPKIDVKIHDLSISRCNKTDYLGLILDEELKWNKHIDYMRKKTIICNF